MTSETVMLNLLVATLGVFAAGAAVALSTAHRASMSRVAGHGGAVVGGALACWLGAAGLMGGRLHVTVPEILPVGGVALGLDRLSAFFIVVIAVGAIPAAFYAIGYTRADEGKHSLAAMGFWLNVFLASMVLVTLARNILTFLILWEMMSLASYFLVMTESEHDETPRAGWIYLVMTHAGFTCLLIGFLWMARASGAVDFAQWHTLSTTLDSTTRNVIFVLLALGFGSKAGVMPMHIWLPRAHPAAPSHVSALMSGVMIKLGIYGLMRAGFDWLGVAPAWWGAAVLLVAAVSAILGVLYALVEHDLKRLLAYHSVENVGIILFGVGAAMLFQTYELPALGALALVAALYHTLNHAIFKSLLFLGAGAVVRAAGTRNMEEMGGLIRRMPQTAVLFLVGSLAIAALPPLNGFVSEWLTFQALLLSFRISGHAMNLIFALAIGALALTGGLAAACFVKAFGITFLALPRSDRAANAREVDGSMRAGMGFLALACVVFGLAPGAVISPLDATTWELVGEHADLRYGWSSIAAHNDFGGLSCLGIAAALVGLLAAIAVALRFPGVPKTRRVCETWGCGRALQTARFEYTATAFANPFKRVFALLYRPVKELEIEFHPESRFFVRTITYRNEARTVFEDVLYRPVVDLARLLAQRTRVLQSGNVHTYLLYIFLALVVLLLLAG